MANSPLTLSILDQSPVFENETAAQAFQHTIDLAKRADSWVYHRYWVAEHHGSDRVMGSSPEVLISHLLAKTNRIRVGSGGVMLQHYSPYKVAENFNVLASLAPGRVDLGIGRGPGGMPQSTKALQAQSEGGVRPLGEKIAELRQFLGGPMESAGPLHGLQATPAPPQPPDLYLLGTTASSGEMAAELGLPYVFALFLNNDEPEMRRAMEAYHRRYNPACPAAKRAMLALPVVVADTGEEAANFASQIKVIRIKLESGRTLTVGTYEAGEEFGRQSGESYEIKVYDSAVIHGTPETVIEKLFEVQKAYDVAEIVVVTAINDFEKRLRSYELLSGAFAEATG